MKGLRASLEKGVESNERLPVHFKANLTGPPQYCITDILINRVWVPGCLDARRYHWCGVQHNFHLFPLFEVISENIDWLIIRLHVKTINKAICFLKRSTFDDKRNIIAPFFVSRTRYPCWFRISSLFVTPVNFICHLVTRSAIRLPYSSPWQELPNRFRNVHKKPCNLHFLFDLLKFCIYFSITLHNKESQVTFDHCWMYILTNSLSCFHRNRSSMTLSKLFRRLVPSPLAACRLNRRTEYIPFTFQVHPGGISQSYAAGTLSSSTDSTHLRDG